MLVDHLCHCVAQQHYLLVKRFNLTLQLDAIYQIDGDRHVLAAQCVQERILQELTFIAHDILRVRKFCCKPTPYHSALCSLIP